MNNSNFFTILIFINIIFTQNIYGECKNKYCFPDKLNFTTKTLELHKYASYKFIFFRIYTVALYKSYETSVKQIENLNSPKALTLHFHRDIEKDLLIKGAKDVLRDNPTVTYRNYEKELKKLNDSYKDVKDGESITLLHEPKEGLSLIYEDRVVVKVKNPKFSNDYLGIWLSKWPVSNHLRQKLL